jgi:hypothetical protein
MRIKKRFSGAAILIFFLGAVFLFYLKVANAGSDLIINEIMYDLPGADDKHEWLELYNAGLKEIDLTGFKVNDGDDATNHALNIPPKNDSRGSLILAPGNYLLLAGDAKTLTADLNDSNVTIIDTAIRLNNSSSTIKIFDQKGQIVTEAFYSKDLGGAGNSESLEWDGIKFKPSVAPNGTPGKINSVLTQSAPLPEVETPTPTTPISRTTNLSAGQKTSGQKESESQTPTVPPVQINPLVLKTNPSQPNGETNSKKSADRLKIFDNKTLFWLLGIISLSLIVSLGLIYFKKQKAKYVNNAKDKKFF